jgi:hypothetical protein
VQERFPKLTELAKQQVALVNDTALLRRLVVKLSLIRSAKEAKQLFLQASQKHDQ